MIKAVIFDMDGVIVDTEPLHHKAYHKMFDDVNIKVPNTLYKTFTGQSTYAICEFLCKKYNLRLAPQTLVDIKRDHFKFLFEHDTELQLIEGVLDLITNYHNNGLTLVLASSASMSNINQIFERFNLNSYFKAKLSGADLKASKPHPEIFINAAKASGFDKHKCIVIEDSTNGIEAAKAAGIYCIGFKSQNSINQDYSKANKVIKRFEEIHYAKLQSYFRVNSK
ncbi:MAG: HAD family phosphatase [Gelidibacter sp.]